MEGLKKKLTLFKEQVLEVIEKLGNSEKISITDDDIFEIDYHTDTALKSVGKILKFLRPLVPSNNDRLASVDNKCRTGAEIFGSKLKTNDSSCEINIVPVDAKLQAETEFIGYDEIDEVGSVAASNSDAVLNDTVGSEASNVDDVVNSHEVSGQSTDVADFSAEDIDELMEACAGDDDEFGDASTMKEESQAKSSFNDDADTDVEEDDVLHQPPDPKYSKVLKQYFGHSTFRPMQWKIINSVLNEKRDQCVIMATGYGKSLCYQYPPLYTGGLAIVVSPLISLMEDQVLALKLMNINAAFFGTAQAENNRVKHEAMSGTYRLLYMTPEFVTTADDLLIKLNKNVGIDVIAVDEAHCVSQWGHDFRSSYRVLGKIRQNLPYVTLMALTATATPAVRRDICDSLRLKNPLISCTGFDRPNLYLSVSLKSDDVHRDLKEHMVEEYGQVKFPGPTIIYCPTKKATESTTIALRGLGVSCARYHAGLTFAERKQSHQDFVKDKVQVIVATVAFGMGIDKPDVRKVIHYGAPKDIESYYQEIGRAGRDGQPSSCHVTYAPGDFATNRFLLNEISNAKFLQHKQEMLNKMEQYLFFTGCRRKMLLSHFEDKEIKTNGSNNCCDNCRKRNTVVASGGQVQGKVNYGEEAKHLLFAVQLTEGRFGMRVPIYFLLKKDSPKLYERLKNHAQFGCGRHKSENWWKAFGRLLVCSGHLKECKITGAFGSTIELGKKGEEFLRTAKSSSVPPKLMMQPSQQLLEFEKVTKVQEQTKTILPSVPSSKWLGSSTSNVQVSSDAVLDPMEKEARGKVYSSLMLVRNELADEHCCAPYMVTGNKVLLDIAKFRPSSVENLSKLEDFPEVKVEKFGASFVKHIRDFCREHNYTMDNFSPVDADRSSSANVDQRLLSMLSETTRQTYVLFHCQNHSVEKIGDMRGIKPTTVKTHLAHAVEIGLPVDLSRLGFIDKIRDLITEAIRAPPINSDISRLPPIKEVLPDHITFDQIKLCIALLKRQFGLTDDNHNHNSMDLSQKGKPITQYQPQLQTSSSPKPSTPSPAAGKRKLPSWMNTATSFNKKTPLKRAKSNSLFGR